MKSVFERVVLIVVCLVLLCGLGATAYAGTFSRYWADDYCYAAVVQRDGLIRGTLYWYQNGGNRFAAFLAVGLIERLGQASVVFLPSGLLIAWAAAASFALNALVKLAGWKVHRLWLATASLGWVFFLTYTSPDRLQTLYWRMGLLHYSLPLVLILIQAGVVLGGLTTGKPARLVWISAANGLLALFCAGLSETAAALQTTLYLLLAAGLVIWGGGGKRNGLVLLSGGLMASLLALLIMALSPANEWRQALLPPPPSAGAWGGALLRYTIDFVRDTLRTLPLPLGMWLAFCGVLGYLLNGNKPRNSGLAGWALLAAGIIGTAAAMAPSVYAGLQYPAGRALMTARFPLMSGLGLAAAAWGNWLKGRLPSASHQWVSAAGLVGLLLVGAYVLRATQLPLKEAQMLAVKAARWDARQAEILSQRAAGLQTIRVREVDVVSTLEDLTPQPEHWVNGCAADYYQVEQIIAER
ncbi:hypothetical protein BECAL_00675 [Bellilinea caldifistulae]|uniref:Uncharacterized protein n=1 Tax=Bellilinea caldifistulae TaxID=360411 RepID=A0A0P6XL12_9CHLR|nr:DUF6056 family protein [Bellilinea caldifistulae]KPL72340.1 hypothetical protein AC812_16030 [Bellilinea caldifistulae]GAP09531.1 hypothetical protein BECAL_00675 [Bellilinea caldifistulae]